MDLEEKVVLITGSSIGIGAAAAKEFAKATAKVVITYHSNKDKAKIVAQECQNLGAAEILLTELDVTNNESIEKVVKEVVGKWGQIDILVNNAGVFEEGTVAETSFEEIEHQVRVNLEGLIKMTHAALPNIKAAIINIGSRAGLKAYAPYSTYGATKWAVRGFTKSLAEEITLPVYCVNPKGTATEMNDFTGDPVEKVGRVIVDLAAGKIQAKSGDDINVWEY